MVASRLILLLPAMAGLALPGVADAQSRRGPEHRNAYESARAGQLRPFGEIMAVARREAPGSTLIGSDFDREAAIYRMKFMRDGAVFWLDVDGRTGEVVGRSN